MPPKAKTSAQQDPDEQLAAFIAKFDPPMAILIRSVRTALQKRLPAANELVYDNYNFFVIGYCSTDRASDCIVSLQRKRRELCSRSITAQPCPIRREYFRAAAARTGSFAWLDPKTWRNRKSKHSLPPQFGKPKHLWQRREVAG